MNQKDKVNVMNKTTYRYHINAFGADTASLVPEVPSIPTGADLQALPEAA